MEHEIIADTRTTRGDAHDMANARLIAAAPELFDIVTSFLKYNERGNLEALDALAQRAVTILARIEGGS